MSYRNALKIIVVYIIIFLLPSYVYPNKINPSVKTINTDLNISKDIKYRLEDISIAKSIGIWEDKKDYGFFTVLVYRSNGIETTRVLIKKSLSNAENSVNDFQIIKDISIPTPYYKGTIQDIHLRLIHNKLLITLNIYMKSMDGAVMPEVLLVDTKGKVSILQEAVYIDAIAEI